LIVFKAPELAWEFEGLDSRIKTIVYAASGMLSEKHNTNLTITCVYRDEAGLHGLYRAVDIRIIPSGGSRVMSLEALNDLQTLINAFVYDEARPTLNTLYIHENRGPGGKAGLHGHLQINGSKKTTLIKT